MLTSSLKIFLQVSYKLSQALLIINNMTKFIWLLLLLIRKAHGC